MSMWPAPYPWQVKSWKNDLGAELETMAEEPDEEAEELEEAAPKEASESPKA